MTCKQCIHEKVCPHLRDEDAERCKVYADKNDYIHIKRYDGTIGEVIRAKRVERGWSQEKLADKIMVTYSTVSNWESGNSFPNSLFLIAMAKVFECSTDELCGEAMICQKREH